MDEELEKNEVVSIDYFHPKFWHRCMANLVDFLLFIVTLLLAFIATRQIMFATPWYKNTMNTIESDRLSSSLYVQHKDDVLLVTDHCDNNLSTYNERIELCNDSINNFSTFLQEKCGNDVKALFDKEWNEYRLDATADSGVHLFVKDGDEVVVNPDYYTATTRVNYYNSVYSPFINDYGLAYLNTYVADYRQAMKDMSIMLIFIEAPVSIVLGHFIVYGLIPLIWGRGKRTLGKALYHIAYVDRRMLSPTWKRFMIRYFIGFAETILSIFTFGIPLLLSFTLMAFSKNKQSFPDYMCGLLEVTTTTSKIYKNYDEIKLDQLDLHQDAPDFSMFMRP